jgi:hypothetical protein
MVIIAIKKTVVTHTVVHVAARMVAIKRAIASHAKAIAIDTEAASAAVANHPRVTTKAVNAHNASLKDVANTIS